MSKKDLIGKNAVRKMKELVMDIDFCMLGSQLGTQPPHTIPMSTKDVDDMGNIYFLSGRDSDHNQHIKSDPGLFQLIYSDPSSFEFLTIYASAQISTDPALIDKYFESTDNAWFEGANDPNISVLIVRPID